MHEPSIEPTNGEPFHLRDGWVYLYETGSSGTTRSCAITISSEDIACAVGEEPPRSLKTWPGMVAQERFGFRRRLSSHDRVQRRRRRRMSRASRRRNRR